VEALVSLALAALLGRHLAGIYRREREALAEAELATVGRKELLAMVAHDLRSPITAIALRASRIRGIALDEKIRQHAGAIERTIAGTERMLRTLLDLAMLDARHFSLDLAPCTAEKLLHDLMEVFEPIAAEKSIRIESGMQASSIPLRVDRERIMQVLANLLGNAVKFSPAGSAIVIAVEPSEDFVQFRVIDRGAGIPAADLPHIFDRFWQGKIHGSKGVGLGLYIGAKVAEAHGGRIWAESTPETGTTFHFAVPATTALAKAADVAHSTPMWGIGVG
jgi:signal transduction histidine kinase